MKTRRAPITYLAPATAAAIISKSLSLAERWRGFTIKKNNVPGEGTRAWFVVVPLDPIDEKRTG